MARSIARPPSSHILELNKLSSTRDLLLVIKVANAVAPWSPNEQLAKDSVFIFSFNPSSWLIETISSSPSYNIYIYIYMHSTPVVLKDNLSSAVLALSTEYKYLALEQDI